MDSAHKAAARSIQSHKAAGEYFKVYMKPSAGNQVLRPGLAVTRTLWQLVPTEHLPYHNRWSACLDAQTRGPRSGAKGEHSTKHRPAGALQHHLPGVHTRMLMQIIDEFPPGVHW